MNERIEALAKQAAEYAIEFAIKDQELYIPKLMEKFAELLLQAVYDEVKEELVHDSLIHVEQDTVNRAYLNGSNGGVTDALIIIKNFGKDVEL